MCTKFGAFKKMWTIHEGCSSFDKYWEWSDICKDGTRPIEGATGWMEIDYTPEGVNYKWLFKVDLESL
jgi:hypothetical protein